MELMSNRQASYVRKDGTTVYRGEDAVPYIDDKLFMVADGLGGTACIRHSKVNRDIFNSDLILDTFFHDVFEDGYNDPKFEAYVKESFSDILGNEAVYMTSASDIKKSGYYASRIVTSLFLHMVLYDWKDIELEKQFDHFFDNIGEAEQKKRLEVLGDSIAKKLRSQMIKIAKNANLYYETSIENLALLGTTLSATVFSEDEETVHAAYFTAGDSRSYIWTVDGGMTQLLLDQEHSDGAMSNCINITGEQDFNILVAYYAFPKKCILFNATDGCFDCGPFLMSQMAFEKKILDSIVLAHDLNTAEENLHSFFVGASKLDDSSTLAMKIFGYNSFEELQEACNARLRELDELYFSKMPDLLSVNYRKVYQKQAAVDPAKVKEVKEFFGANNQVKELCRTRIGTEKYQPYMESLKTIDEEIQVCRKRMAEAATAIEEVVCNNYLKYYTASGYELGRWDRSIIKQADDESDYSDAATQYSKELEEYKKRFDDAAEQIQMALEGLFAVGIPETNEIYEILDFDILEDCEKTMDGLFKYFEEIRKNKHEILRRIYAARKRFVERNQKYAKQNMDFVQGIVNRIISGESIPEVELLPEEKAKIQNALECIQEASSYISNQDAEKEKIADSMAEQYWELKYESIIRELMDHNVIQLDCMYMSRAHEVFGDVDPALKELKEKAELQDKLFAQYELGYKKYLGGNEA